MAPKNLRFGGGAADSAISPVVAIYLLIAVILILTLPRNKAITPFLFAFFTIPVGEVLVLGGFHFTALRVLILAGLAKRATIGKSQTTGKFPGGFNAIDRAVVVWSVSAVVALCLVFMAMPAVINALGVLLAYRIADATVPPEVLRRFEANTTASTLAQHIQQHLFVAPGTTPMGHIPYDFQLLDFRDRIGYLLSLDFLRPSERDRATLPLPTPLHPLYYLIRPFRIFWDRSAR